MCFMHREVGGRHQSQAFFRFSHPVLLSDTITVNCGCKLCLDITTTALALPISSSRSIPASSPAGIRYPERLRIAGKKQQRTELIRVPSSTGLCFFLRGQPLCQTFNISALFRARQRPEWDTAFISGTPFSQRMAYSTVDVRCEADHELNCASNSHCGTAVSRVSADVLSMIFGRKVMIYNSFSELVVCLTAQRLPVGTTGGLVSVNTRSSVPRHALSLTKA
ncbi:hypothetical protein F4780DRAFT_169831 [Xylariomycetidae sp. FL0641]|nr:hypothetical protein F4780DRAFT_169831 [Xylariomycetidae sp. FL0641]